MAQDTPLIGTWTLESWFNQADDGTREHPFGLSPTGYISYSHDGYVFVHMARAERAAFAVPNDPFGGSEAEDSRAFKSHLTYAGTYEHRGDKVIHSVTQSFCPNWIGTNQVRDVDLDGDTLRLSAKRIMIAGQVVDAFLEWRRAARPKALAAQL